MARRKPSSASAASISVSSPPRRLAREPGRESATAPRRRGYAPCACLRSPADSCRPWATGRDRRPRLTLAPALCSRSKIAAAAVAGSASTVLPFKRIQRGGEIAGRVQPHVRRPDGRSVPGCALLSSRNRSAAAVGMKDREGQRERRVGHVAAANVEQPADGIASVMTAASASRLFQARGDAGALGFGCLRPPD